jgi:hypothetical protein
MARQRTGGFRKTERKGMMRLKMGEERRKPKAVLLSATC